MKPHLASTLDVPTGHLKNRGHTSNPGDQCVSDLAQPALPDAGEALRYERREACRVSQLQLHWQPRASLKKRHHKLPLPSAHTQTLWLNAVYNKYTGGCSYPHLCFASAGERSHRLGESGPWFRCPCGHPVWHEIGAPANEQPAVAASDCARGPHDSCNAGSGALHRLRANAFTINRKFNKTWQPLDT